MSLFSCVLYISFLILEILWLHSWVLITLFFFFSQYFVYGGYFIVLGFMYLLMGIFTIVEYYRSSKHFNFYVSDENKLSVATQTANDTSDDDTPTVFYNNNWGLMWFKITKLLNTKQVGYYLSIIWIEITQFLLL